MKAKKSLGQNFLKSEVALRKIVEAGEIKSGDTILEIGPGLGVLTKALSKTAGQVIAIEAAVTVDGQPRYDLPRNSQNVAVLGDPRNDATIAACRADLQGRTERLVRRGELPVGGLGQRWRTEFVQQSAPMALQWNAWCRELAEPAKPRQVTAELDGLTLDDWLDDDTLERYGLYREAPDATPHWCHLTTRPPMSGRRHSFNAVSM